MASVMLFPNVATHRRLPHLSNEPKKPKKPKGPKASEDDQSTSRQDRSKPLSARQVDESPSDSPGVLSNGASQLSISSSSASARSATSGTNGQKLLQSSAAASENMDALTINTTSTKTFTDTIISGSTSSSTGTRVGLSATGSPATPHTELSSARDQKHHELDHSLCGHHAQVLQPRGGPNGTCSSASPSSITTPLSALPPSGAPSSLTESKMIKAALFDAFGCLYHPVQHTHHPSSSSSSLSSSSVPHGRLSPATVALRSGEVTPLITASPGESPMLRPYMGASTPITPLELSLASADAHASGGGYFGLHTSGSTPGGLNASSCTSRHLHTHHHHLASHPHPRHHRRRASSSHPDDAQQHPAFSDESSTKTLSRRQSLDFNLNPSEHPVLCSLHTLSLTHPHPPEHYHPHLGHDLGHDRVLIEPPTTVDAASAARAVRSASPASALSIPPPRIHQPLLSPKVLLPTTTMASGRAGGESSSLFLMDCHGHGGDFIGIYSEQKLL